MKEYKLVKHKDNYYLIEYTRGRMAKDLPAGTIVLCLDEIEYECCIRGSASGDHCYGCQPIVATNDKTLTTIPQLDLIEISKELPNKNFIKE